MGKHKGPSLFESYLSAIPQSSRCIDNEAVLLPDSMRASTLLEQIGKDKSWDDKDVEEDTKILTRHRLNYVRDLRSLSDESWKYIELLPLVRDLLRSAIGSDTNKNGDSCKKEKKKKYKKPMHLAEGRDELALMSGQAPIPNLAMMQETVSEDPETVRNTLSNLSIDAGTDETKLYSPPSRSSEKKSVSFTESCAEPDSSSSSDSSSGSSNSADEEEKKASMYTYTGGPSIKASGPNRIKVRTNTGEMYECDRFCPHKGKDLTTYGQVIGNTLVCTKHNWTFNLDGNSPSKKTVHPCRVNDW